jgi:uncharacterized protein (DUF1810 family)
MNYNLERFIDAQTNKVTYQTALKEVKNGLKVSHWMWYIFPQIKGLGFSYNSVFYAVSCADEAKAYLEDPVLGPRLREISTELLKHTGKRAEDIFGDIDSRKLRSSMTLFNAVCPNDVFAKVLDTFFASNRDKRTLDLMKG